mmetsp:Transcript_9325/g.29631  ORF Transcript_9325/g.29631 Transcript_9325/m.29631 type:complete len:232 (-) Transcript_9325:1041-1736(-)
MLPESHGKHRHGPSSGCGIKRRAKQSSPPRLARSGGGDQRWRRLRLERRRLLFPRLALPRLLLLCGGGRGGPLDKDGGEYLEGDLLAHVHPDAARRAAMHHHLVLAGCLGRVERKLARHRRQREGGGERREADQGVVPRGSLHGHIPILADRLADDPPPLLQRKRNAAEKRNATVRSPATHHPSCGPDSEGAAPASARTCPCAARSSAALSTACAAADSPPTSRAAASSSE